MNGDEARHAGLRSAVHQHLVRAARLAADLGRFYDDAFDDRQEADYGVAGEFEPTTVQDRIAHAERFVAEMKRLLGR